METKQRRRRLIVLIVLIAAVVGIGVWLAVWSYMIRQSQQPAAQFDPNTWIVITPPDIVSADGEQVFTEMRIGSENKVLVFFYGGGVSVNEFTAARPFFGAWFLSDENGFYTENVEGMIPDYVELGIGSRREINPFSDWTVIIIPYTTGDFHLGTADYEYTALDGTTQVLHHHGYTNYRAIMDVATRYIDTEPEELLIVGYSAGGYGAAALADDVKENYFPNAGHTTVCVDSSLLLWDRWMETMHDVWGVPDDIAAGFMSENPVVDFMTELYEKYGDSMTYLYIGSVRDGELARYQNFFNTGIYSVSNENGWMFTSDLRQTTATLKEKIPTIGIYLFDGLPFSLRPNQIVLTQHTILITNMAFWFLTDRVSPARWLYDAVNGNVTSHGLNLLR